MSVPSYSDQPVQPEKGLQADQQASLRLQIWETPLMRQGSSVLKLSLGKKLCAGGLGQDICLLHIYGGTQMPL
ncbi:hypothetical protein Q0F98_20690 [Paenibacillus amylolyticus]|nr:hypothetical protein Q0F98_20690 [Paenibacillus amylolyticus]